MDTTLHHLLMSDHSLLQKCFFAEIQELGLTPGQPKVLDFLQTHDGAMQKDIARGCCIEPASLSTLLNGMERKGLICRRADSRNRRNTYIHLTENGRALCGRIRDAFRRIETQALRRLSADEAAALTDYLIKIKEELESTL